MIQFKHFIFKEYSLITNENALNVFCKNHIHSKLHKFDDNYLYDLYNLGNRIFESLKNNLRQTYTIYANYSNEQIISFIEENFDSKDICKNDFYFLVRIYSHLYSVITKQNKKIKKELIKPSLFETDCSYYIKGYLKTYNSQVEDFNMAMCDLKKDEIIINYTSIINISKKLSDKIDFKFLLDYFDLIPMKIDNYIDKPFKITISEKKEKVIKSKLNEEFKNFFTKYGLPIYMNENEMNDYIYHINNNTIINSYPYNVKTDKYNSKPISKDYIWFNLNDFFAICLIVYYFMNSLNNIKYEYDYEGKDYEMFIKSLNGLGLKLHSDNLKNIYSLANSIDKYMQIKYNQNVYDLPNKREIKSKNIQNLYGGYIKNTYYKPIYGIWNAFYETYIPKPHNNLKKCDNCSRLTNDKLTTLRDGSGRKLCNGCFSEHKKEISRKTTNKYRNKNI